MTYKVDEPLTNFKFWAGAKETVEYLTDDEIDIIEDYLDDGYTYSEEEINDFFWFERDVIAEVLGYLSFDEIMDREKEEDE